MLLTCKGMSTKHLKYKNYIHIHIRDVTTGVSGATAVATKFSDTLTLSQPRGAGSAHHCRGRS